MNTHVRILIGVVASLLIHITSVIWITQPMKVRPPDRVVQVALNFSIVEHGSLPPPKLAETTPVEIKKPRATPIRAMRTVKLEIPLPVQTVAAGGQILGNVDWHPPSTNQQSEIMNTLQLTQLAHQRELQVTAILSGLSAISSQLRPIITDSIVCTQQVDNKLDCVPELKENERSLIVQFFNLALQAHQLGITQNPAHMDFGTALGVSVMLRNQIR